MQMARSSRNVARVAAAGLLIAGLLSVGGPLAEAAGRDNPVVTSSTSEVNADARAANSQQDLTDNEGHGPEAFTGSIDETVPAHEQVTGASSDSSADFSAALTGTN